MTSQPTSQSEDNPSPYMRPKHTILLNYGTDSKIDTGYDHTSVASAYLYGITGRCTYIAFTTFISPSSWFIDSQASNHMTCGT